MFFDSLFSEYEINDMNGDYASFDTGFVLKSPFADLPLNEKINLWLTVDWNGFATLSNDDDTERTYFKFQMNAPITKIDTSKYEINAKSISRPGRWNKDQIDNVIVFTCDSVPGWDYEKQLYSHENLIEELPKAQAHALWKLITHLAISKQL